MHRSRPWLILIFYSSVAVVVNAQQKETEPSSVLKPYIKNGIELFNLQSLNSTALDFSPAYYQKGLVYVSSRVKSGLRDPNIDETFFELFYSEFTPNNDFSKPINFSVQLNSRLHEGPVSFNRESNLIYLTRSNLKNDVTAADKDGRVGLKIYEAEKGPYDWQNIKELPFNSNEYSCMHPALSPDGNRIFFASNKPGGYGGYDLYMAEKRAGIWSEMYNLGPEINTPGNEVFPFLHESGVLFFSSDGHKGMGKLDIFFIDIRSRTWGQLTTLGEPFNSRFDDFGFIVDPAGRSGFFTSDRPGGVGKDDLYGFRSPQGINGLFQPTRKFLTIQVKDKEHQQFIAGAAVYLFERGEDGLIANNNLYDVQIVPTAIGTSKEVSLRFIRKSIENFGNPVALTQADGKAVFQISQGKDYILLIHAAAYQSKELLVFAKSPGAVKPMEVELQPQDCKNVSVFVRSESQQAGLSGVKLSIRAQNESTEEVSFTTIEGRSELCLTRKADYFLFLEKEGYHPLQVSLEGGQVEISSFLDFSMKPISETDSKTPIAENTVVVLPQVNSDFSKNITGAGEDRYLSGLLHMLEVFPEIHIELGVHTDSRGEATFNLQLSQSRAETAKSFLVERGIAPARIRAVGYGERQLKNGCEDGVPCSEAEHQKNRRTEIRVIQPEPSGN